MNILGIIPARYGSTRFPAKALADIGGKSMIRRVYEQATKSALLSDVVIATDHEAIMQEAATFGGKACMTSENHQSGTDRCYEALTIQDKDYDYVINIQGDEPFINPSQNASFFSHPNKKHRYDQQRGHDLLQVPGQ